MRNALIALLALAAGAAQAADIKPGLWEIRSTIKGDARMEQAMRAAQQQLAQMPPAQRKQVEAMMAKNGARMDAGGITARVCMTPELIAKNMVPMRQEGDCRTESKPAGASTLRVSFTCTQPAASGEGTVTFAGGTSYTMAMTMRGPAGPVAMEGTGTWKGADCQGAPVPGAGKR